MSQEVRAVCPACASVTRSGGQDAKFYYNPSKGVGHCFHCGFKGKFNPEELMEELNVVDIRAKQVFDPKSVSQLEPLNEVALRYLSKRFPGVSASQLENFGLRYAPKYHAIAILLHKNDKLSGIKYRFIAPLNPKERFMAEPGSEAGGSWYAGSREKVLVVEGEFDGISAKLCQFEGTVVAGQTNRLSEETLNALKGFKNVFLGMDNDQAGQEGNESTMRRLESLNPIVVKLPNGIKDISELLERNGLDEASQIISESIQTELETSTYNLKKSIPDMVSFLSNRRNTEGDTTGWKSIDHLLGGGLRPNELTLIVAFAKTGKTSFINNIVHNLAANNKTVGIASFEMDPATTLYPSILSIASQTNLRSIGNEDSLRESVKLISQECPYLHNILSFKRFGYTPWNEVEEWATMIKARYNIDFLVLDHSGFLTPKMTDAEENQILAKNIKKLSLTLGIHILCVVQAPKSKDGLSIQTAYGGMAWSQNCDNFFILERDRSDESLLKVRLEASRYPGSNPSYTPSHLYYDRETGTLAE